MYDPAVVTVIDRVVSPVDQKYESASPAVSVTLPPVPAQNDVGPSAVIVDAASATVAEAVALQPFALTVTEYVSADETVIEGVVSPVDQR